MNRNPQKDHNLQTNTTPYEPEANDKSEHMVKHPVRTGLPPGISPDEARNPGSPPGAEPPVDNRS